MINRVEIRVLKGVSFKVNPGEIVAVMGGNGSGKSTLLRLIAGFFRPSRGRIAVLGKNPTTYEAKKEIGYLPENLRFHRGVSGREFLLFLARLRGIKNSPLKTKIWLEKFGIDEKWQKLPIDLYSEGMKQRTGLASAFFHDPKLLLLDEPLENLDQGMKTRMVEIIKKEAKNRRKIVILAMHSDSELEKIVDRQYTIENGVFV